jgi:nucleoside-diphosphate-sugar epimerase
MNERALVTGATGFVGNALCSTLLAEGRSVRAAVRSETSMARAAGLDVMAVGEVGSRTDWSSALTGVDCVIHCAARAHVMHETETDALAAYREVNVAGTKSLAEQAAALGVRRLVFLSSIKVNGEQTALGAPFCVSGSQRGFTPRHDQRRAGACGDERKNGNGAKWSMRGTAGGRDDPSGVNHVLGPEDPYGVSKHEAEQALWDVAARTSLEVVVVRPPLVYGPGVKGNLLRLLRWVARGVPLPIGAVRNQRSLVGLSNLLDLLIRCSGHPAAAGKTFLASDGVDLSTPELIQLMAEGMNTPVRLLPVPVAMLRTVGSLLGKGGEVDRLVGSLQVDSRYTRELLDWTPPVSVEDGVREMSRWYLTSQSAGKP